MSKKELMVLTGLICILVLSNAVNYLRREHLKRDNTVLVQKMSIRISINGADADDLTNLPGIGPSIAQRIVEYRQTHGTFKNLGDLKKIKGIGDKLFKRILPYIKL